MSDTLSTSNGVRRKSLQQSPTTIPVSEEESLRFLGLIDKATHTRAPIPLDIPSLKSLIAIHGFIYLAIIDPARLSISQFGVVAGLSPAWASRLVDGFLEAGLVNLIQNDKDRRIVEIELAPEAKDIASSLWLKYESSIIGALNEVAPHKRPMIQRFLLTLTSELRKRSDKRRNR